MEDFFKYIPIALWVLYKIYGRSKSNEQKTKSKQKKGRNSSTPSLEDIFKELSGDLTKEKPVKPVNRKKKNPEPKKINIQDQQDDFRLEYEHQADAGLISEHTKDQLEVVKMEEDEAEGKSQIDLREAIIYDAILNRPKY